MTTYVFVHGSWHGSWCWYKIKPRLERRGHDVVAIDLPAHGTDTTPVASVTFDQQVSRVTSVLESQEEPVVLVGHSHGGAVISHAAERRPAGVETLVYVCGFLLEDDQPIDDIADDASLVVDNRRVDTDAGTVTLDPDIVEAAFYGDCPPDDIALARALLRPAPITNAQFSTTASNFGSIPRVYIRCRQDRAVTPSMQDTMVANHPGTATVTMDTGHAPFFAAPNDLVDILTDSSTV